MSHILREAKQTDKDKMTLEEIRAKMSPCPICGRKAFIMHDIVDGFEFGYSAGCPAFCLDDGIHGISESFDENAPRVDGITAEQAFARWEQYCKSRSGD